MATKKPALTDIHARNRLNFANYWLHSHRDPLFYRKWLICDESTVHLKSEDQDRIWVKQLEAKDLIVAVLRRPINLKEETKGGTSGKRLIFKAYLSYFFLKADSILRSIRRFSTLNFRIRGGSLG